MNQSFQNTHGESLPLPIEIEALYSCDHMVIARTCVVEIVSKRILPPSYPGLAVNEGGVRSDTAIRLPQTICLYTVEATGKTSNVAVIRTREVQVNTK